MSAAGPYRVLGEIGDGGMGSVFMAIDTRTDTEVALKRLKVDPRPEKAELSVLRFRREYHTLASLAHPRVVRVFDYGVDEAGPYYTMELLGGRDLRELIKEQGRLGAVQTCAVLRDVASALALVHARGLVHRDLTARNVRIIDGRATLFDFGVLMREGKPADVAGTVTFVAPELMRGLPVDGRADLFSLGVLAYVMLSGERPFEARRFAELEDAWRTPPRALSDLCELPEALEDLVHDLLCLDPLGRPASAALLVDRLTAIGALEPDPSLAMPPAIGAPAAMVGRDVEMGLLRRLLSEAREGAARSFYLHAETGAGKTRVLQELVLQAKLEGSLAIRVPCDQTQDGVPYAALTILFDELLAADPALVEGAVAADRSALARLFPILRDEHTSRERAPEVEPAEERIRLQAAIERFIRELCRRRPLSIVVDDVQRCDEASAASLASLARAGIAGLVVGVALRRGETVRAPLAVASLARLEPQIELGGLHEEGVYALARASFGDTQGLRRLARRLHAATGGSPLHCMELLRALVSRGEIHADAGTWIVPEDVVIPESETSLASTVRERLASIAADTRAVGEAIAIFGGGVSLPRAMKLAQRAGIASESDLATTTFRALGELVEREVLIEGRRGFVFRHDSAREALLAGMSAERMRTLHRWAGEVLLSEPETLHADASALAQAGWHLHRGGEIERGAQMLGQAGRRLFDAHALADCVAPLEIALAVAIKRDAPLALRADLSFRLLSAGWVADRAVGARHASAAVELWADLSGMAHVERWTPYVGLYLAFALAFIYAHLRWLWRRGAARGPSPQRAIGLYAQAVSYATAIAYASNHFERAETLAARAAPFRVFSGTAPHAAYLMPHAMCDILRGRLTAARERLLEIQRVVAKPGILNPLTAAERRNGEAAARSMRSLIELNQFDAGLEENLRAIDAIGLEYYRLTSQIARAVRHRYRGEEARARELELASETTALQLGAWSTDLQRLLFAHPAYALCHDVEGLKRSLDALVRRTSEGMNFDARATITRAELMRERGEYDESITLLAPLLETLSPHDHLYRQWACSCLALAALEGARYADAARFADLGLEDAADERVRLVLPWLRLERVRALADDALGQSASAERRLDRAIEEAERLECTILAGELHEARARVALAAGDRPLFERHRLRCAQWLRPTDNPGLVAIALRLEELERRDRVGDDLDLRRKRPSSHSLVRSGSHSTSADQDGDTSVDPLRRRMPHGET